MKWSQKQDKHRRLVAPVDPAEHNVFVREQSADERLAWVYEEIAKLNLVDRSLTLLLLDGLSYKEMAAVMGISETNIGVKINRIKKKLSQKSKNINHGI